MQQIEQQNVFFKYLCFRSGTCQTVRYVVLFEIIYFCVASQGSKRRFNCPGLGCRSFFKSQEKANPAVFVNFLENVSIHVCREVAYLLQPNVGLGT